MMLHGHENLVDDLIFAPDGRFLFSSGWDRHVKMWNLAEDGKGWGKVIDDLACHGHVFAIATTPDGNYLTAAGLGGFTVWKRDGQSRGSECMSNSTGAGGAWPRRLIPALWRWGGWTGPFGSGTSS